MDNMKTQSWIVRLALLATLAAGWWHAYESLQGPTEVLYLDATKANYVGAGKSISDYPGRLNLNQPGRPLRRDWLHGNSIDYTHALDRIVINSVQGEFDVIDHGNTFVAGDPAGSLALAASSAGDSLYRFGDPARYEQGDPPSVLEDWTTSTTGHKQIGGSHHRPRGRAGFDPVLHRPRRDHEHGDHGGPDVPRHQRLARLQVDGAQVPHQHPPAEQRGRGRPPLDEPLRTGPVGL
jgi:hypothetical protein